MPLVEGSAQRGKIGVDQSNIKYEDISLKAFCKTRKGNEKTVFKLFMEVVKKPLLRMLTDEDFQNTETAIDMRTDLSFPSKKSYKSILNNLKERIDKHNLQNVELKTDKIVSWENLKPCPFRQKNSKEVTVCRNKNVPINTSFLTPQACELCIQVTEEMTQLEQITGVKPRLREYKALKIIKEKLTLKNNEIQAVTKDRDFFKHELVQSRKQTSNKIEKLQNTLSTERSEKEKLTDKQHNIETMKERLETREKSLDKEVDEKVEQAIEQKKKGFIALTLPCPISGKRESIADTCYNCPKNMECSEYAKILVPQS